jgi:formate hydrogenlyase subunit 4
MLLEYSGRYLAFMEWGASIKQLVLMAILTNLFLPLGLATNNSVVSLSIGLVVFLAKLLALCATIVIVETVNAKLRLFRVPDLLSAAFVLAALALLSTFIFQ